MKRKKSISLSLDTETIGYEFFDHATVERGRAYAREQRIEVQDVERGGGEVAVYGTCRGSSKTPYSVSVLLYEEDDGALIFADASCTCPVGVDCKHAFALLETFSEMLDGVPDAGRGRGRGRRGTKPEPVAAQETPGVIGEHALRWLHLMENHEVQGVSDDLLEQDRLVYVLCYTPSPVLRVGKSRPLKRGGLSKPTRFSPSRDDVSPYGRRKWVSDADITPLSLYLSVAQSQGLDHYYYGAPDGVTVQGEMGALLLMSAARTGRLFLEGNMLAPVTAGEPRPLGFKWLSDEEGMQHCLFDLPSHVRVLPTLPPLYHDGQTHATGELHSPLPESLFRAMVLAPPLNPVEASLARERLQALLPKVKARRDGGAGQVVAAKAGADEGSGADSVPLLPLPGSELEVLDVVSPPRATLRLGMGRFRHHALNSLEDAHPVAELHLHYEAEGAHLVASAEAPGLMNVRHQGESRLVRRDVDTEQALWRRLQAVGLESYRQRMPSYERIDSCEDCLLASPLDARGWMPLLEHGLPELEAVGIGIEYAEDFPFHFIQPEDWFVDVEEENEGGEWFKLDLGVIVDGERISLVAPLIGLLREQPDLLRKLDTLADEEQLPLRLDRKRLLSVPVPRLRNWLKPLLEFLDEGRPRLSRLHAASLAALDEQPTRWLGGEALRELGQKLRNFGGVTPVAPAPTFNATLRGYQQQGLNWLQFLREYGFAGVLADDMGLGKTVQTLAHVQLEKAQGRADRPSLVIAPTSLLPNWANEARQFAPDLKVLTLHGPNRAELFEQMAGADLILSTYPLLVRDQKALLACQYHMLVLDEAQFIKNPKAQSHRVARQIEARHRLSLTGTPLENHLGELWAQFDFLMPGLLGQAKRFNELFRTPIEKQGDSEARIRLGSRVAPFMLRRTKEQVLEELPPCTEIVRWVELEGAQRDLYESLRVVFDKKLREALKLQGVGRSQIMILDALLKLRQACCDPRLVKLDSARKLAAAGRAASAKLVELMNLIDELVDEGRRILLFSQFTSMLGLIEAELKQRKLGYAKLTGQTRDRDTPVRAFQNGEVPIFLISLKAGGTGLNLTAADTVIHYDPWWNPAAEAQATARAHRMGQDKPVFVYKLLGRGTVEEKILELQSRKRGLADQLLGGGKDDGKGHLLTAEDLDVLFQPLG
ncbi:MAG: DEAD/DEAH box helicase [Rhodocyclaceae bacterium]